MASTKEPVTVGGWYEHTDGTIGEYRWDSGQLRHVRTVARWADVPSKDDPTPPSDSYPTLTQPG